MPLFRATAAVYSPRACASIIVFKPVPASSSQSASSSPYSRSRTSPPRYTIYMYIYTYINIFINFFFFVLLRCAFSLIRFSVICASGGCNRRLFASLVPPLSSDGGTNPPLALQAHPSQGPSLRPRTLGSQVVKRRI